MSTLPEELREAVGEFLDNPEIRAWDEIVLKRKSHYLERREAYLACMTLNAKRGFHLEFYPSFDSFMFEHQTPGEQYVWYRHILSLVSTGNLTRYASGTQTFWGKWNAADGSDIQWIITSPLPQYLFLITASVTSEELSPCLRSHLRCASLNGVVYSRLDVMIQAGGVSRYMIKDSHVVMSNDEITPNTTYDILGVVESPQPVWGGQVRKVPRQIGTVVPEFTITEK